MGVRVRTLLVSVSVVVVATLFALPAAARSKFQGWVEQGGLQARNQGTFTMRRGAIPVTNPSVQQSYPNATVLVCQTGYDCNTDPTKKATIYADAVGTSQANPFTAASTGYWSFWGDALTYDIRFSGGGIATPYTLTSIGSTNSNVVEAAVSSTYTAAQNVAGLRAAVTVINAQGGGTIRIPARAGTFEVEFDDLVTQYYGLIKFRSNTTFEFEAGATLSVTGSDPAIFAGVFGPDTTALPIANVKFVNVNATDTISGTDPQLVRFVTLTPTFSMAADSVTNVEISGGTFTGFASPVLIAARNSGLAAWEREVGDVRIHHNYMYDVVSAGATLDGRNISFTNNHVYGQGAASYDCISIHACDGCLVSKNVCGYFSHPSGITFHVQNSNVAVNGVSKGTRNVVISDNISHDTYGSSKEVGISVVGSSPLGCTNISAINNTIVRGGRGIQANQNGDVGSPFHTITITNNRIATYERGLDLVGNLSTKKVYDFAVDDNLVQVTPSTGLTYLTGTVATMAAGGTALVGSGTLFLTELAVNDYVNIAGWVVKVSAIADDLNATVSAYPGQVAATGSTMYKYGAGVIAANSWGMRLFFAERGSASNNDIMVLNGSTNSLVASLDGLRDVKINDNVLTAGDDTIVSLKVGVSAAVNRCTFSRNTFRGQSTWAANAFVNGFAEQNQFRTTSGANFNGHEVGNSTIWGYEGSRFWRYGTAAPVGEGWLQYDEIINSAKTEAGGAGSKYVVEKWFCSVAGPPGTWLEQRTLTGN